MAISNISSARSTTPPPATPRPIPGGRAVLARKADRQIAAATANILSLVNGSVLRPYVGEPALTIIDTQDRGLCLVLQSGHLRPVNAVLPESFRAAAASVRATSLKRPLLWATGVAAFTWAAAAFFHPWLWALGVAITSMHGAGVALLSWSKLRVAAIDNQLAQVRELAAEIQDWKQRKQDALDSDGPNLQTIYEQRRQRDPLAGLQSPYDHPFKTALGAKPR